MVRHIGEDWPKKHLHFSLETRLMLEKSFRDAWLNSVCDVAMNTHEPLAKSIKPYQQQMLQRKVACFSYNQYGAFRHPYHTIPTVDRLHGINGIIGTRQWVPFINLHAWTFNVMVRSGHILVHRVHWRGWGTDKHLKDGGWEHRWWKTMQRNAFQFTRI